MEQPQLQTKCPLPPTHRRRRIAYTKICLLSRVWFSRSTLACKITSTGWEHIKNLYNPEPGKLAGPILSPIRPVSWFFFYVTILSSRSSSERFSRDIFVEVNADTAAAFVLWSQSEQQFFFTSETELTLCLPIASGHKVLGPHLWAGTWIPSSFQTKKSSLLRAPLFIATQVIKLNLNPIYQL